MNSTQQWQSVTWFDVDEHQDGQRIDNFLFTRLKVYRKVESTV